MFAAAAVAARLLDVSFATHSHGVAQYSQLLTEMVDARARRAHGVDPRRRLGGAARGRADGDLRAADRRHAQLPERAAGRARAAGDDRRRLLGAPARPASRSFSPGIVAGLAGLVREDLVDRGRRRHDRPPRSTPRRAGAPALCAPLVYGLVALATVTPVRHLRVAARAPLHADRQRRPERALPRHLPARRRQPVLRHRGASPSRSAQPSSRDRATATCRRATPRASTRCCRPSTPASPSPRRPRPRRSTTCACTCSASRCVRAHAVEEGLEHVVAAVERRQRRRRRRPRPHAPASSSTSSTRRSRGSGCCSGSCSCAAAGRSSCRCSGCS